MSATYDEIVDGEVNRTYRRSACFSNTRDDPIKSGRTIRIYIKKRWTKYGLDEIKKYVRFLNRAGFPCEYVGYVEAKNYGYGGRGDPTGSFKAYAIDVHDDDLLNETHRLATQSLVRYLWEGSYTHIPNILLDLNLSTNWDEVEIIMLAHHFCKRLQNKGGRGHCCLRKGNQKLISKEEYFDSLEEHDFGKTYRATHVHESFQVNGEVPLTEQEADRVLKLYEEGEYEKAREYYE